ncbi:MAG TPA: GDSL-type esterase/lipase family protein, partial [Chitinophagaceae bacterium]|nr:GDSL-type esterase/lipase family protein [Chitinophagaceae bacterium]
FSLLLLLILSQPSFAQQPPFYDEIQHFKSMDSAHFPPRNAILFVGSSSFRKWTDVQSYFPEETIINRGFGGSTLSDVIYYARDIILPYHPREIVIYCGENDLAYSDTITAQIVFERFKKLFSIIRAHMPHIPVVFLSIKPSPSRERLMSEMAEANKLISNYIKKQPRTFFVDIYHKMLDSQGKPMADIFLDDNLHMNAKGYHIWQKALLPYLQPDKK